MSELGKKLDTFFNKIIPKKLLIMLIATVLVFMNKIDGFQWFIIAGAYLGVNVIQHYAKKSI